MTKPCATGVQRRRAWVQMFAHAALLAVLLIPATLLARDAGRAVAPVLEPFMVRSTADPLTRKEPHMVRVLVSYSRTNYFLDDENHQRGFEYELMKQYEAFLNKRSKKKKFKTLVIFIPVPFSHLLPDLLAGRGDIIAAGMTVTPERQAQVAFTNAYVPNVSELVVTHKSVHGLQALEDLAGQEVYVLRGSSYAQHLRTLNQRFKTEGRQPVRVVEASENLATEDILELVNAGIVKITVADSHLAAIWKDVLPDIRIHTQIAVNTGGNIAWAVRQDNPALLRSLNAFVKRNRRGTLIGNVLFKRYYQNTRWVQNPLTEEGRQKLDLVFRLFRKYGKEYGFDWLAIVAQAYQESGLDQSMRSKAGAVGIMQIKPETAADPRIGIRHIEKLENNVHAGVKYLDWLRATYFSGSEVSEAARVNFSFAAYNAGPGKIARLRKQARARGLDPNAWFRNVELIARKEVGRETVQYVKNIHKYYIAYKLLTEGLEKKEAEIEAHK